jgi:hypothetical protein
VTGRRAVPLVVLVLGLAVAAGCGVTRLQTARTVPRGETRTTLAASLIHTSDRGFTLEGIPIASVDVMVRHGATDQVDWGVRTFLGLGLLVDGKWNLLPPEGATALAVSAGLGGARDASGPVVHVPLTVTVSRAFLPWLTPYAAIGYGSYWIFGRTPPDPTPTYAPRTWTGDGLAMVHLGLELARASGRALLLEYTYARPVVDDPGDFYGFGTNHFFSIAFHTGRVPMLSR